MMKIAAMAVLAAAGVANADVTFNDSVDDIFDLGFGHLDIRSVTLSNDATNLYASISVNGNASATNWGKYLFMFDTNGAASGRSDNPWGRNISTNGRLNDVYVGSWVDQNPDSFAQIWRDNGAGWSLDFTVTNDRSLAAIGIIKYTFSLADLGMSLGNTIYFDVMTTGGGDHDPGVDHLSNAGFATPGWGDTSVAGDYLAYNLVPTPGSLALVGLGGLAAMRRRR
ncbi:MAG: PEP-CTERM sorting domain-containing protein [Planctomycetota bacterium]